MSMPLSLTVPQVERLEDMLYQQHATYVHTCMCVYVCKYVCKEVNKVTIRMLTVVKHIIFINSMYMYW